MDDVRSIRSMAINRLPTHANHRWNISLALAHLQPILTCSVANRKH